MNISRKQDELLKMKRVQDIYCHPFFKSCLEKNRTAEETRIFCRHDMTHFLNVARLAYIFSLERNCEISKEEIYAAALLHDIGKWQQYEEGKPHEKVSAEIARIILEETGFLEEEKDRIITAILKHRKRSEQECVKSDQLTEILYDADKISRNCFHCPSERECNWDREKKNLQIIW